MADIPKPKSPDERVFVSAYRFDSMRAAIVKYLIPGMGVFCLVAFPWWCLKFYQMFDAGAPEEIRTRLRFILGTILLMGVTSALMFFWLSASLRKKFFDTFVIYDKEGIRFRSGAKETGFKWSEIREIETREAGRLQTATLIGPTSRFTFDASLFNSSGSRPSVKMGLTGEKLVYTNGDVVPMKIRDNELFGVIEKKLAAVKKAEGSKKEG